MTRALCSTNTILQGTVCADKKVLNLPVFRFRTESTALCNAFSSVESMEPTLFFQIFAPSLQPPPPATIASDPHVLGLHKQQYDVLGKSGSIYALLSDFSFFVNARFATAYTTGVHMDANHVAKPMRPSGTWIDQVGIMLVIDMTTADSSTPQLTEVSEDAPQDAADGSVTTVSVVITTELPIAEEESNQVGFHSLPNAVNKEISHLFPVCICEYRRHHVLEHSSSMARLSSLTQAAMMLPSRGTRLKMTLLACECSTLVHFAASPCNLQNSSWV